jgi:diguanylate cyclase (GGDEF)-like protein
MLHVRQQKPKNHPLSSTAELIGNLSRISEATRSIAQEVLENHAGTTAPSPKAIPELKPDEIDYLSGLANRRAFTHMLDQLVADPDAEFSVMLIDVDHFKHINDRYGHNVGDIVVQRVSDRLKSIATKCSLVARLGGDEFGLIIPDPSAQSECETELLAGNIIDTFNAALPLEEIKLQVTCSLGAARFPEHARSSTELIGKADLALYEAKARGRNCWVDYFDTLGNAADRASRIAGDLKSAIADHEVEAYFQSIVDLKSSSIRGYEILARWRHPILGMIGAGEFVPVIARLGLSEALTLSLFGQAARAFQNLPGETFLSLNVSAEEVCGDAFAATLLEALKRAGFEPSRLQVEITEQALMRNLAAAHKTIDELRSAGVSVYLDDFGTGYSGLCYLRELTIDGIKIDKIFASDIADGSRGRRVLEGILALAANMSLAVVVEGIETEQALKDCRDLGVSRGQGYFFQEPFPVAQVSI